MGASNDLVGKVFGRLRVIEKTDERRHNFVVWRCRCECGCPKYICATTQRLIRKNGRNSCGCLRRESATATWQAKSQKIAINGATKSIGEWAKLMGLEKHVIYHRLKLGWSGEDAVMTPVKSGRTVTLDGETKSLSEWAEHLGISASAIYGRLAMGWSVQDAVTKPLGPNKRHKAVKPSAYDTVVTHNGKTQTIRQWAESILDVTHHEILMRLKNGWSVTDALTQTKRSHALAMHRKSANKDTFIVHQCEKRSVKEWAKKSGISLATLINRLKLGWDFERALSTPVRQYVKLKTGIKKKNANSNEKRKDKERLQKAKAVHH